MDFVWCDGGLSEDRSIDLSLFVVTTRLSDSVCVISLTSTLSVNVFLVIIVSRIVGYVDS